MNVQIRTQGLSELQVALQDLGWDAVALLRKNGFDAEYRATMVSAPSESPGYIVIKGQIR